MHRHLLNRQTQLGRRRIARQLGMMGIVCHLLFSASYLYADEGQYRKIVAEGVAEHSRGNFAEARALFKKAHSIMPNARTLRGMGVSAFEMREYVDALELLEQALENRRRRLTGGLRKKVEELVARCRDFIASYTVELAPADAKLSVDGAAAKLKSGQLLLDPGLHEIVVEADGYQTLSRSVRVKGGERSTLELELELEPEPIPSAADIHVTEKPEPERVPDRTKDAEPRSDPARLWTWFAAGGAAAFAGAAGVFWLLGQDAYSDIEEECKRNGCPTQQQLDRAVADTSFTTYETLTTVSLVLSATSLVGAGVLFFVEAPSDREAGDVTVVFGEKGLQLSGSF
jgi:tetratricopeptide (TPR) repeat protein